jgi:hypothetical protein
MASKQQLLAENDALLELLEDINDAVDLPADLENRIEDFLSCDDDDGSPEEE